MAFHLGYKRGFWSQGLRLQKRLEKGPMPASDLIKAVDDFGFTPKILRDAGKRLNMKKYKDGLERWMLKLPDQNQKNDDV